MLSGGAFLNRLKGRRPAGSSFSSSKCLTRSPNVRCRPIQDDLPHFRLTATGTFSPISSATFSSGSCTISSRRIISFQFKLLSPRSTRLIQRKEQFMHSASFSCVMFWLFRASRMSLPKHFLSSCVGMRLENKTVSSFRFSKEDYSNFERESRSATCIFKKFVSFCRIIPQYSQKGAKDCCICITRFPPQHSAAFFFIRICTIEETCDMMWQRPKHL